MRIAIIFILLAAPVLRAQFEGLSGADLARAVREAYAPRAVPSAIPAGHWQPDDWPEGWMPAEWPCTGTRVGYLMPPEWISKQPQTPVNDLYNLITEDETFALARATYPPGNVEEARDSGDGWKAGTGFFSGMPTNVWQGADDRLGDIARRFMYLALMYPQALWADRAILIMEDGEWPLLTADGVRLLAQWAASDPADGRETDEMLRIASAQGNENPFITLPRLFDYLWGEKAGQGYVSDEKTGLTPLKATYSRRTDRQIDLYSPYVPADARWQLDGTETEGASIDLTGVATGTHTLSFISKNVHGRVKITVTE